MTGAIVATRTLFFVLHAVSGEPNDGWAASSAARRVSTSSLDKREVASAAASQTAPRPIVGTENEEEALTCPTVRAHPGPPTGIQPPAPQHHTKVHHSHVLIAPTGPHLTWAFLDRSHP